MTKRCRVATHPSMTTQDKQSWENFNAGIMLTDDSSYTRCEYNRSLHVSLLRTSSEMSIDRIEGLGGVKWQGLRLGIICDGYFGIAQRSKTHL